MIYLVRGGGGRRPVDGQLVISIEDHITKEPFASARKIALELNISHDTVRRYLIEYLGTKSMNFKWVPPLFDPRTKRKSGSFIDAIIRFFRERGSFII